MILSPKDIATLRVSGQILSEVLSLTIDRAKAGVTPIELDAFAKKETLKRKAEPAFFNYRGYPNSLCVSTNDEVVHGIPTAKPFAQGDIVSIDFGVKYKGIYTDAARTIIIGKAPAKIVTFVDTCRQAFYKGLDTVKPGARVGDIGEAIQRFVEARGYAVVRALVGHGVGKELHEDPVIPNFGIAGTGPILHPGMALAIEPMITVGHYDVITDTSGWTIRTKDHSMAAHYENTLLVTDNGYDIITES